MACVEYIQTPRRPAAWSDAIALYRTQSTHHKSRKLSKVNPGGRSIEANDPGSRFEGIQGNKQKIKAMERPNGLYNAITNALDSRNRTNRNLHSPMVLVREDIKGSYHCIHMADLSPRVRRSRVIRTPIRVLKRFRKGQNVESNLVRRPS